MFAVCCTFYKFSLGKKVGLDIAHPCWKGSCPAAHPWTPLTHGEAVVLEWYMISLRAQYIFQGTQLSGGKAQARSSAVLPRL